MESTVKIRDAGVPNVGGEGAAIESNVDLRGVVDSLNDQMAAVLRHINSMEVKWCTMLK